MLREKAVSSTRNAGCNLDQKPLGVCDVRNLRKAADALTATADWHRAALIDRLGLKRYIFNALGQAAHRPAGNAQLVWPDGTEQVEANGARLGDYLYARAQREHDLPRAVVVDGKKYHL
jgi:hypothetical protein